MSTTLTKQFNKTVDLVVSPTNNNPAKITLEIDAGNSETINLSTIAANASTAATDVSGATDANTPSTIVKRDASGNFSAGIINANLIGNVTGNVSGTAASITGNLTGDVTSSGMSTTLATVNANTGPFGSSTAIPSFTVNGKGLITAASTNVVVAPASTLTGTTLASNVVTSSLTSVGTISSGTWSGTTIAIAKGGTGQTTANAAVNALLPTQTSNSGKFLTTDGTDTSWAAVSSGGTGTVTSVDLTMPTEFTVSGNPVTASGTLAVTKATQLANKIYAGPTTGSAAVPTFRSVVAADIPTLNQNTTGSAATLTTPRNINGVAFDGSAAITVTADANTLSGTTLASGVTASSLTSVGTITSGTWAGTTIAIANGGTGQTTRQTAIDALTGTQSSGTYLRSDGTHATLSSISAGDVPTLNQNTSGSAAKWTTTRNLAGNSVDGSANVAFANKFIVQGTTDTGLSAAQFLGALGTGILKNTTTTGVLSIAVAGDFPTLNQNTTGSAATLTTPRAINGTNFDGSAAITVTAAAGTLTGTTLNSSVVTSSLTSVGTISSGTWSGTTIALNKGGTGQTTKAAAFDALSPMTTSGDIIYGGASGTGTRLAKGSNGDVLTLASGVPSWVAPSAGTGTITAWNNNLTWTTSAFGTISNVNFWYRRVGDSMEVRGSFTAGTVAGTTAKIILPNTYTIDSAKYSADVNIQMTGYFAISNTNAAITAANFYGPLYYDGTDTGTIYFAVQSDSAPRFSKDVAAAICVNGGNVAFNFTIPITGWTP